jgi:hypothetical protein
MNLRQIQEAFRQRQIVWRQHALVRMMERDISRIDIIEAIDNGDIVEDYPDLKPYPGCLVMGKSGPVSLHVVLAWDEKEKVAYIITVYIPDPNHFHRNGKTRKGRGEK